MAERPAVFHGFSERPPTAEGINARSAPGEGSTPASFGQMFPCLKKCDPGTEVLEKIASAMLWEDQPVDPSSDSKILAGYTVLGQFITHDLTLGLAPLDGKPDDPATLTNYRTPKFDLDSVYGLSQAPDFSLPFNLATGEMLYQKGQPGQGPDDLLRAANGTARIPDTRNDDNVLIGQMHLAFLKLHNQFVANPSDSSLSAVGRFEEARRRCQWHFQWVVVNDFLPKIVGQHMVDKILLRDAQGSLILDDKCSPKLDLKFYKEPPTVPVEFAAAAFRFGHSMIRSAYRVNAAGTTYPLFGASPQDDRHLGGHRPLSSALVVDWARFFDLPKPTSLPDDRKLEQNFARKIDSFLNGLLGKLSAQVIPAGDTGTTSLPLRDLQRGIDLGLPSGQDVAGCMGVEPLSEHDLGLTGPAPLWFYLLKEAELTSNNKGLCGEQLGPVGGRIVAEVILGLLAHDKDSYLNKQPDFRPEIQFGPKDRTFSMADLLVLAGVAATGA